MEVTPVGWIHSNVTVELHRTGVGVSMATDLNHATVVAAMLQ